MIQVMSFGKFPLKKERCSTIESPWTQSIDLQHFSSNLFLFTRFHVNMTIDDDLDSKNAY